MSIFDREITTDNNIQNIIFGTVIDNNDPENAGRIRVLLDNYKYKIYNYEPWKKGDPVKGTITDPFIVNPFLPKLINVIPKKDELVKIIFYNPNFPELDKEYVGPIISQYQNIAFENSIQARSLYQSSQSNLGPNLANFEYSDGLLPNIEDITLLGRKSTDITIKDNDILLRSGKVNLKDNKKFNKKGSVLQISSSPVKSNVVKTKKIINKRVPETINNVVIYNINNDNSGYVNVYKLSQPKTTDNINIGTDLTNLITTPSITYNFSANTQNLAVSYVNQFLQFLDKNQVNDQNTSSGIINVIESVRGIPYLFKPLEDNSKYNTIKTFNIVKAGFRTQKPIQTIQEEVESSNITNTFEYQNYMVALTDALYLISQESSIPEKGFINFDDIQDGISNLKVKDELESKTEPMVRGDQLVKALVIIINAFLNHVHSGFGFMEVNQTDEINKLSKLRSELNTLILNKKIRIN